MFLEMGMDYWLKKTRERFGEMQDTNRQGTVFHDQ